MYIYIYIYLYVRGKQIYSCCVLFPSLCMHFFMCSSFPTDVLYEYITVFVWACLSLSLSICLCLLVLYLVLCLSVWHFFGDFRSVLCTCIFEHIYKQHAYDQIFMYTCTYMCTVYTQCPQLHLCYTSMCTYTERYISICAYTERYIYKYMYVCTYV